MRAGIQHFIDDMGPSFDSELELDRIDNDGDYSLDNCRWSTESEQMFNRRSNGCLGLKRSDESKEKQSKTINDKMAANPEAFKQEMSRISRCRVNFKHNEESKAKISEAQLKRDPATRKWTALQRENYVATIAARNL